MTTRDSNGRFVKAEQDQTNLANDPSYLDRLSLSQQISFSPSQNFAGQANAAPSAWRGTSAPPVTDQLRGRHLQNIGLTNAEVDGMYGFEPAKAPKPDRSVSPEMIIFFGFLLFMGAMIIGAGRLGGVW